MADDDDIPAQAPPSPDEGAPFGHFVVPRRADGSLWELGRGAMGVTYRAFDTSLRIEVALKVITGDRVQESDVRRRFQREARAAARIRHPNIASVLYLGEQGGEFFYAMEFIAGRSVDCLLKDNGLPLPITVAVALAAQAAAALNAAHRREVVHRDLKPANLMLLEGEATDHEDERIAAAEGRQLKMIDFGLARSFGLGRKEDSLVTQNLSGFIGTPAYASPEQCIGDGDLDGRADLYSLGIILWQMLTGALPFTGRVVEVLGKHQFQPPPLDRLVKAGVPGELIEVLRGLLIKDPAERQPQTAGELRTILDNLLRTFVSSASVPAGAAVLPTPADLEKTSDSTTPPVVGATLLSRYRLGHEAGAGNGGRLFLAADNDHPGRRVGLKLLRPERLAEPVFAAQLETAIEYARQHPHPVLLIHPDGLQRAGGSTFYVREWAEGFSLLELLRVRGALRAGEVRRLLETLPGALDHAVSAEFPLLEVALHKLFVVPHASGHAAYGDWLGLRSLAVEEWPEFALKLNPLGFPAFEAAGQQILAGATRLEGLAADPRPDGSTRLDGSDEDETPTNIIQPDEPGDEPLPARTTRLDEPRYAQGNVTCGLARIIRELLGGEPGSLAPLSAVDGEGNAILRRAQEVNVLPAAYPSAADFAARFFATIRETFGQPVVARRRDEPVDLFVSTPPPWRIGIWSGVAAVSLAVILAWLAFRPSSVTLHTPKPVAPSGVSASIESPKVIAATPVPTVAPTPEARLAPVVSSTPVPIAGPPPTPTPIPAQIPILPPAPRSRAVAPVSYRGKIYSGSTKKMGTAITVDLDADRTGGTITYGSSVGDTRVRFTAISKDTEVQAVTKEVLSKPRRVQWTGEVFHLHLSPDESEAIYACDYPESNLHGTLVRQSSVAP